MEGCRPLVTDDNQRDEDTQTDTIYGVILP